MNTTTKCMMALVAAAVMAGAGVASAAAPPEHNGPQQFSDDGVTLMFDFLVFVEVEFKGTGTGIYGITPPHQPCPVSILGLRVIQPLSMYYDGRVATNLKTGDIFVPGQGITPLGNPCPIPGTTPEPQGLHIADMNIYGPRDTFTVFQDYCVKNAFWVCSAKTDTSPDTLVNDLDVYSCPWASTDFYYGGGKGPTKNVDDNQGILGGTGLQSFAFSRGLKCTAPATHAYEYSDDARYDLYSIAGEWGLDFAVIQNHDLVEYYDMHHYVVACMYIEYNYLDTSNGMTGMGDALSYDWKLVLDIGTLLAGATPGLDTLNALAKHFAGVGGVGRVVEGWSDQGGQNGCPFAPVTHEPPDKKIASFPMVPLPQCANLQDEDGDGETDWINPFALPNHAQQGGSDGAIFDGGDDCSTPFDKENDPDPGNENY